MELYLNHKKKPGTLWFISEKTWGKNTLAFKAELIKWDDERQENITEKTLTLTPAQFAEFYKDLQIEDWHISV